MPLEKLDKTLRNIDKTVGRKIGETAGTTVNVGKKVGNYYADRLAGLAEAVKEGFEHTNPARVKMTPDESMSDKEKNMKNFKEKLSEMTDQFNKNILPASDKDIEILKKVISSDEED